MANYPAYQPMNPYQQPMNNYSDMYSQSYAPMYPQPPRPSYPLTQQPAPTVRGRFVSREEDITPNEIGMDGQVSFFPLADYSAIIAKLWDSKGQIQTFKFVPLVETEEKNLEDKSDMILGRLDDIEGLLKHRFSNHQGKRNQNGSRNEEKEVNDA